MGDGQKDFSALSIKNCNLDWCCTPKIIKEPNNLCEDILQSTLMLLCGIELLLHLSGCRIEVVASPYLGLSSQFTAGVPLAPLSSGSAHWAIWRHGDATHESPQTGRNAAVPDRLCTASDECRRCRRHPRRSDGRGGWGWWCAPVCCFYSELWWKNAKCMNLICKGRIDTL